MQLLNAFMPVFFSSNSTKVKHRNASIYISIYISMYISICFIHHTKGISELILTALKWIQAAESQRLLKEGKIPNGQETSTIINLGVQEACVLDCLGWFLKLWTITGTFPCLQLWTCWTLLEHAGLSTSAETLFGCGSKPHVMKIRRINMSDFKCDIHLPIGWYLA